MTDKITRLVFGAAALLACLSVPVSCRRMMMPTDRNIYVVDAEAVTVREGEDTPLYLTFRDGGMETDNSGWGDAWEWAYFNGEIRTPDGSRYQPAVFIGPEGVLSDGQQIALGGARRYDLVIGGLLEGDYIAVFNIRTRYGVDTYATTDFKVLSKQGQDPGGDDRILAESFTIPTEMPGASLTPDGESLLLYLEDYNEASPFIFASSVMPADAENGELRSLSDDGNVVVAGMRPGNVLTLVPRTVGSATVTMQTVDRTVIRSFGVTVDRRTPETVNADDFSTPDGEEGAELDLAGRLRLDINTYDRDNPFMYVCRIYPADAANGRLRASSSDDTIAEAHIEDGTTLVITPGKVGRADITVSTEDGTIVKVVKIIVVAKVEILVDSEEGEADETMKKRQVFPCALTFKSAARVHPVPLFLDVYAKVTGRVDLPDPNDHFVADSLKNAKTAYHSMSRNAVMAYSPQGTTRFRIYDLLMKPVTDTQVKIWHDADTPSSGYRVENFSMYSVAITVKPQVDYDPDLYIVTIREAYRSGDRKIYRFLND